MSELFSWWPNLWGSVSCGFDRSSMTLDFLTSLFTQCRCMLYADTRLSKSRVAATADVAGLRSLQELLSGAYQRYFKDTEALPEVSQQCKARFGMNRLTQPMQLFKDQKAFFVPLEHELGPTNHKLQRKAHVPEAYPAIARDSDL